MSFWNIVPEDVDMKLTHANVKAIIVVEQGRYCDALVEYCRTKNLNEFIIIALKGNVRINERVWLNELFKFFSDLLQGIFSDYDLGGDTIAIRAQHGRQHYTIFNKHLACAHLIRLGANSKYESGGIETYEVPLSESEKNILKNSINFGRRYNDSDFKYMRVKHIQSF